MKIQIFLLRVFAFFLFAVSTFCYSAEFIFLDSYNIKGAIPIKSWKTLQDSRIIKQNLDYSCGAASLATILNEFYDQKITEDALLKVMEKGDLRASFEDMQRALLQFGFRSTGYATSFEQLAKLKIPVVIYLKYRKDDHFSVLRGINENTVWLADPSLGNRTYNREQFLEMWETRDDGSGLKGKILVILPNKQDITMKDGFFTREPQRQTAQAIHLQTIRNFP